MQQNQQPKTIAHEHYAQLGGTLNHRQNKGHTYIHLERAWPVPLTCRAAPPAGSNQKAP